MKTLVDMPGIKYPIILAPMFLVTNQLMVETALENGITAAIPAMNFRQPYQISKFISDLKSKTSKPFGINIIVNRSNTKLDKQIKAIFKDPPYFLITSLGNPQAVIKKAHKHGVKVFCDVTDLKFAKKVEKLGADAIIAVNKDAGGHSGNIERDLLLKKLLSECNIPIINAGGVASAKDLDDVLSIGAAGASIGTLFIASKEAGVSDDYKQALIDYGANDIVMTTKLSGVPSTVINTEYVQKIGVKQNLLEFLISRNTFLKKTAKKIIMRQGESYLRKAAFSATYKTFWCASKSIENISRIRSLNEIIKDLTRNIS